MVTTLTIFPVNENVLLIILLGVFIKEPVKIRLDETDLKKAFTASKLPEKETEELSNFEGVFTNIANKVIELETLLLTTLRRFPVKTRVDVTSLKKIWLVDELPDNVKDELTTLLIDFNKEGVNEILELMIL